MTSINVWGPKTWLYFHCLIHMIKNEYHESEFNIIKGFIKDICGLLPCPDCRSHALFYLNRGYNKIKRMSDLKHFMIQFHNNVNIKKGKNTFSIIDYNRKYDNINKYTVVNEFFNTWYSMKYAPIFFYSSTVKIKLLNKMKKYIKNNVHKFKL